MAEWRRLVDERLFPASVGVEQGWEKGIRRVRHVEGARPDVASNPLQGGHPRQACKGVRIEIDPDLQKQTRGDIPAKSTADESKRLAVFLGRVRQQAVAGQIGPPKLEKGGRRHSWKGSFRPLSCQAGESSWGTELIESCARTVRPPRTKLKWKETTQQD